MSRYSANQQKLIDIFEGNYPYIKNAYRGALHALNVDDYPDRLVHFCQSLREVIDLLAKPHDQKSLNRIDRSQQIEQKIDRAQQIEQKIDPTHSRHPHFKKFYKELARYYSELSEITHHNKFPTQEECESKLEDVEQRLLKLTMPQTEVLTIMDQIIKENPTKENAKKLQEFLFRSSSELYVLESLTSDWIQPLNDIGFFDCTKLEKHYGENSSDLSWTPSRFLSKHAKEKPDIVKDIILDCNMKTSKHNWIAILDFLDCAIKMPITHAVQIAKKSLDEEWYIAIYCWDPYKYANLAIMMYCEEKYELAINMLNKLLKLKLTDIQITLQADEVHTFINPMIDKYPFKHILDEKIPILYRKNPLIVSKMLTNMIEESISLWQTKYDDLKQQDDHSRRWKPNINDYDSESENTPSSILVEHLRYCLERMGDDNIDNLRSQMEYLKTKHYDIFHRLEMHIYKIHADKFKTVIEKSLVNYFNNNIIYPEYYELFYTMFGSMSKNIQNRLIIMIDKYFKRKSKMINSDQNYHQDIRYQKFQMLDSIKTYLDDEHKTQYNVLENEFRPDQCTELNDRIPPVHKLPSIYEIIKKGSPAQVFNDIKQYKITQNEFLVTDTIPDLFREYVENHSEYCSAHALEINQADPIFLYELLSGLKNAIRAEKNIDWHKILELIEFIIHQYNKKYSGIFSYDLIIPVCSLLKEGFENKSISFDLQKKILDIVQNLVKIGNTASKQEYSLNDTMDSLTLAINNRDGTSFEILFKYAIWHKQNDKSYEFSIKSKKIMDNYLNDKTRHTVPRHAMFGAYLPNLYYLDSDWAKTICSRLVKSKETKIAFWEGYICNKIHKNIFNDLQSLYNEFLNGAISNKISRKTIHKITIRHMLLAYVYDLDGADDIFKRFIKKPNYEKANYWRLQLEYIISDYKNNTRINKDKIRSLLNEDMFIQKSKMWLWLRNKLFDKKETLDIFLNHLTKSNNAEINYLHIRIEDLQPFIKEFPIEVAKCLQIISDKQIKNRNSYVPPVLESILRSLFETKNKLVIKICCKIIDNLILFGYLEYKNLLDEYSK